MNKLTFVVLLVGLFVASALARSSPQIRRPFKFTPGQTYIYEYRGRQWNGIPKLADQYAGLTIDCDVILQALGEQQGREVLMRLDDVKVEQLHTQALLETNDIRKLNQGLERDERQMALYKQELAKPIRFTFVEGKIVRFVAESSDAEWSINIKKSILSLFQLDLAPQRIIKSASKQVGEQVYGMRPVSEDAIRVASEMPLVYPIYEESFGGICETLYEIDSLDNVEQRQQQDYVELQDVLNVTKTVNYKNCLTDPSVSYDRHSFNIQTQTIKGQLFAAQQQQQLQQQQPGAINYYPVPEELKQKYSNVYTSMNMDNNVASPVPVERHSYTKYNITTAPMSLVERRQVPVDSPADMSLIEGVYSEGKIKYEADGDLLVSDTQQTLKLVSCVPTVDLARVAPEVAQLAPASAELIRQPVEFQTIQCELSSQKVKFYQALSKFAQLKQQMGQQQVQQQALYSHQMVLPFALSASWFPLVATGQQTNQADDSQMAVERLLNPEQLAKSFENLLVSLAEDVITEDVAQSKKAGEKVVRLINIVAFMPKHKLVQVYDRIVEQIQKNKQEQMQTRSKQAVIDNLEVAKWKVVRKLFLDSLPLAGSKQAVEMIEMLIESQRVQAFEAKELVAAVPANLRYPDTELIDAFVRISQLPQVRKSRSLFAACSIAVGKMVGQAYIKSKDASFRPTTYESANKLPMHLREDDLVRQVVEEADPRRQLPISWNSVSEQQQQQVYERLVFDEQDLIKYVKLYKQMLHKADKQHDKVIFIETLAHMRAPQVLPILEPFVTGRLSLGQCLGSQPLDMGRPLEQSQWYNYNMNQRRQQQQQQQQQQTQKDWAPEQGFAAEECNYMRTIAIYAMAHVARQAPAKVQAILLPVFDNTFEPYQIRIAAFTTMMLNPIEEHILERIGSQMWREPNKDVASFVVGAIDTMSKMTSPVLGPYRFAAQKAAESMPKQYLDTFKFSWLAGGDHFNKQKQTGLSWIAELVKSNVSAIPRAGYMHLGRFHGSAGSKFDNHFELGFTAKGLESLFKEYLAYNAQAGPEEMNVVASIMENLYNTKDDLVTYYREARDQLKQQMLGDLSAPMDKSVDSENYFFKRQMPIEGINSQAGKQARKIGQMFEGISGSNKRTKRSTVTFQVRGQDQHRDQEQEEPKLSLFSKVFQTTNYHSLDKKQMIELLEKCDDYVRAAADELVMGGKLHYVKMLMPSNMWHMVPSQLGLPLIVTHRSPIVASIKLDAAPNGQLTSNKLSQYYRQQATGQQVPNVQGHNFITFDALNITVQVHPKIMHSNMRFMFAVDQASQQTFGVQTEKSHQLSMPMELSVAYSRPKQLVSITVEPKTPARSMWTKEAAKTFVAPLALANPKQADLAMNWLGQEQLVRVPSKQSQYKRQLRQESFVPSLLNGVQHLINEPKQAQIEAIEELETPYKFEHRFQQPALNLELSLEGVTDDEDIVAAIAKPELAKQTRGQVQWTSSEQQDELEQHTKSGPLAEYLHLVDSALTRPSKYVEFYATLKPQQSHKSPVYRFDFVLKQAGEQSPIQQQQMQMQMQTLGRRQPVSRLPNQNNKIWEAIEQQKKLNKIQQQQPIMLEVY